VNDAEAQEAQRTTAMGLITDAKNMLQAAKILHEFGVRTVKGPTYYLLGHAIEVALKSFLLANGTSLTVLRKRIGHDLGKAARRAIAVRLNTLTPVVQEYLGYIELLNVYYEAKEFEYRVTGLKSYPPKEKLFEFLEAIIPIIEPIAFQALKQRRTQSQPHAT